MKRATLLALSFGLAVGTPQHLSAQKRPVHCGCACMIGLTSFLGAMGIGILGIGIQGVVKAVLTCDKDSKSDCFVDVGGGFVGCIPSGILYTGFAWYLSRKVLCEWKEKCAQEAEFHSIEESPITYNTFEPQPKPRGDDGSPEPSSDGGSVRSLNDNDEGELPV